MLSQPLSRHLKIMQSKMSIKKICFRDIKNRSNLYSESEAG